MRVVSIGILFHVLFSSLAEQAREDEASDQMMLLQSRGAIHLSEATEASETSAYATETGSLVLPSEQTTATTATSMRTLVPTNCVIDDCDQACKSYTARNLKACLAGCRYFARGPPSAYVGPAYAAKAGVAAIPAGPKDYWPGLKGGSESACKEACDNFLCIPDRNTDWRNGFSTECSDPFHWKSPFLKAPCKTGCANALSAAQPCHFHAANTTTTTNVQSLMVQVDLKDEVKTRRTHVFLTQLAKILRNSSLSQDATGHVDKSLQHEFQHIFESNEWGSAESRSGFGSTLSATVGIRACLDSWIAKYNVKFLLDIPCGDGNWQGMIPDIANGAVKYHGYDISPGAVARAKEHNKANTNMRFGVLDLVNQVPEEQADMVMIKEVIQHLPLAMGMKMLQHAKEAGIKWLAVTSNPAYHNHDIKPGDWFLGPNAQAPPFNLGAAAERCGKPGKTGGENDFMLFDLEAWKGA